jgi:hypothetical protein
MAKNPITDGTHEDHVRAGAQSHKNTALAATPKASDGSTHATQGGTHEQHVKAGAQSHKDTGGDMSSKDAAHTSGGQGGTHEQHVKAGQQSNKNV